MVRLPIAILSLMLASCVAGAPQPEPDEALTVCEIAADPSVFYGRTVRVAADVQTLSHHGSFLRSADCETSSLVIISSGTEQSDAVMGAILNRFFERNLGMDPWPVITEGVVQPGPGVNTYFEIENFVPAKPS